MKKVTILIPAYNEEKRIGKTLEDYVKFFDSKMKGEYEIFIILNGCRDNTLDVVKKYSKKFSSIRYIEIKEAVGKGRSSYRFFKDSITSEDGLFFGKIKTTPTGSVTGSF